MKKYFNDLLTYIKAITETFYDNSKRQNQILEKLTDKVNKLTLCTDWCITIGSMEWNNVISSNLVEDCRDEWVMIDKKKAIKIVTVNWKAEKEETFTRQSSLTKEEKEHYKKYGIVLIIQK